MLFIFVFATYVGYPSLVLDISSGGNMIRLGGRDRSKESDEGRRKNVLRLPTIAAVRGGLLKCSSRIVYYIESDRSKKGKKM